jgi:hypothetical protein
MQRYKKILVVCPAGAVTGGPEALHQLTGHMNTLDLPAYMCYLPFSQSAIAPAAYTRYKTQSEPYEDVPGNLIIFPEVYPMLALKVKKAQAALWWLSLENFLERRHIWSMHDKVRYLKRVIQGRRPWGGAKSLKQIMHFSQTEHSSSYLRSCGIEPIPLIDSINEDFLTDRLLDRIDHKQNTILFNPTKGWKVTERLINAFPQWHFEPLKGLNREQLSEKLYQAKLYIDFGHHPGRDRMPREAAMHGCCLITGKLGSAGNTVDLPIPPQYKLDSNANGFVQQFGLLATDVMGDFSIHFTAFEHYRKWLQDEPRIFKEQIKKIFHQSIPSA